jgi:hypothetical protein
MPKILESVICAVYRAMILKYQFRFIGGQSLSFDSSSAHRA